MYFLLMSISTFCIGIGVRQTDATGFIVTTFVFLNSHAVNIGFIFYENAESISDKNKAVEEMFNIINMGVENEQPTHTQPVMDWDYDFNFIVAAVNKILGYDVRREEFTHWWTFYSAYLEIGDCLFAQIVSIRSKKQKGKKLEKHEEEFYRANYKKINLPLKLTAEEKKLLGCD